MRRLKDSHVRGPTRFSDLKLLSKCITRNKVSTGEGGLRRIRAELMQGCASATNFRPAAVVLFLLLYIIPLLLIITITISLITITKVFGVLHELSWFLHTLFAVAL